MEPALKIEVWKLLSSNLMAVGSFVILMKNKFLLVHSSTYWNSDDNKASKKREKVIVKDKWKCLDFVFSQGNIRLDRCYFISK